MEKNNKKTEYYVHVNVVNDSATSFVIDPWVKSYQLDKLVLKVAKILKTLNIALSHLFPRL